MADHHRALIHELIRRLWCHFKCPVTNKTFCLIQDRQLLCCTEHQQFTFLSSIQHEAFTTVHVSGINLTTAQSHGQGLGNVQRVRHRNATKISMSAECTPDIHVSRKLAFCTHVISFFKLVVGRGWYLKSVSVLGIYVGPAFGIDLSKYE